MTYDVQRYRREQPASVEAEKLNSVTTVDITVPDAVYEEMRALLEGENREAR